MRFVNNEIKEPHEIPPDANVREFTTLDEYLKIARKTITYFGKRMSPNTIANMLRDDDIVSFVAFEIMKADWLYDVEKSNGKTLKSYRNQRAKWAIGKVLSNWNANQGRVINAVMTSDKFESLDNGNAFCVVPSIKSNPAELLEHDETKEYVQFLLRAANLTDVQRECLQMYYFEDKKLPQIARELGKSTQAVQRLVQRGLAQLRLIIGDSGGNHLRP